MLGLELLEERAISAGRSTITWTDVEAVRARCDFTTHTPVPAEHDMSPMELMRQILGRRDFDLGTWHETESLFEPRR